MDRKYPILYRSKAILLVEELEDRTVPSIFTPAQIEQAYGFNQITFSTPTGTVAGNGAGQTIAIVDAYDDPNIYSDLHTFDTRFGIADPPSFTIMKQSGTVANATWAQETALDVEWAHAIAPGARIVLGEARSTSLSDLVAEVDVVADMPGVSVVSMSWSATEWASEGSFDNNFTTPAGHQGVTYVASSGDNGDIAAWPAISPNVLSVGGTSLYTNANGSYENETSWSYGGGGVSAYEYKPSYQNLVLTGASKRTNPDVSFDANPSTGLYTYNSYESSGWFEAGGTSDGAPQWAALVAIADQGRALEGKSTLDGPSQTLYALYRMAQTSETTYFHDVTSGSNTKAGYDDETGLGSPIANMVVGGLVTWNGSGSSGATGSVAASLATVTKAPVHANDLATPVAPPQEQFLQVNPNSLISTTASTPVAAAEPSPLFNSLGWMELDHQSHGNLSEKPGTSLPLSEESTSVPDSLASQVESQWEFTLFPNVESSVSQGPVVSASTEDLTFDTTISED
jgi:subtilase family serine protease